MTDEAADIRARLERRFGALARTRMQGVPVCNDAIGVAALGFEPLGKDRPGILITPWFMNLVILPGEDEGRTTGEKCRRALPAGEFEFIVTRDEELGPLLMCSLFSPMFEFADQQAALETAQAALAEALNPESRPEGNADLEALEKLHSGPSRPRQDHAAAEEAPGDGQAVEAPEGGRENTPGNGPQGALADAPEDDGGAGAVAGEAAPAGGRANPGRRDLLTGLFAGRGG